RYHHRPAPVVAAGWTRRHSAEPRRRHPRTLRRRPLPRRRRTARHPGPRGGKPCPPALRGWPYGVLALRPRIVAARAAPRPRWRTTLARHEARLVWLGADHQSPGAARLAGEIGRASCRESGWISGGAGQVEE